MVKVKRVDLPKYGDLLKALDLADAAISAVRQFAMDTKQQAEDQVEAHRTLMQKHLDRKELRPHVIFKPHPNSKWSVSFNDQTYTLAPYPDLDEIDDDDPHFWWAGPDDVKHPARSMFQALIGITQDYCNAEHG